MYATLEADSRPPLQDSSHARQITDRLAVAVLVTGLALFGAVTISSGVTPIPGGVGGHLITTQVR